MDSMAIPGSDASPGTAWELLDAELDRWHATGTTAAFWWRDDDATDLTAGTERIIDLADHLRLPLVLAAIPARTGTTLASCVQSATTVHVAQHGYAHVDLSPATQRGCAELDTELPDEVVLDRLARGRDRLQELFDDEFVPLLAAPWNRIADSLNASLPDYGYRVVSTFGPRPTASPAHGLRQVNTHCDIIDWKSGPRFRGEHKAIGDIVEHLELKRIGRADPGEPTGLLTHHPDHDDACWQFLEQLLPVLAEHPAVVFLDGNDICR